MDISPTVTDICATSAVTGSSYLLEANGDLKVEFGMNVDIPHDGQSYLLT